MNFIITAGDKSLVYTYGAQIMTFLQYPMKVMVWLGKIWPNAKANDNPSYVCVDLHRTRFFSLIAEPFRFYFVCLRASRELLQFASFAYLIVVCERGLPIFGNIS